MERNFLAEFQSKLKAPKGQFNSFGKYKYRSCEDIIEAIKPIINPEGFFLTLSDEIIQVSDRVYVKTIATLSNGEKTYTSIAYAREEFDKKGMDASQITGAASSYARKYALNGLFAIDDTKDAEATNTGKSTEKPTLSKDSVAWNKAVEFLKKDGNTIDRVREKYNITPELEQELLSLAV